MKKISDFLSENSVFGGEIFNIIEKVYLRNERVAQGADIDTEIRNIFSYLELGEEEAGYFAFLVCTVCLCLLFLLVSLVGGLAPVSSD